MRQRTTIRAVDILLWLFVVLAATAIFWLPMSSATW
jgi:hypothetical protein